MIIRMARREYFDDTAIGETSIDGKRFGCCLEDAVREIPGQPVESWKIHGKTAIPVGTYRVTLEYSPHFKRIMPSIHGVKGFSGLRIHGGNDHEDTDGCPLFARNRIHARGIQGSQESELTALIKKAGGMATLIVEGLPNGR